MRELPALACALVVACGMACGSASGDHAPGDDVPDPEDAAPAIADASKPDAPPALVDLDQDGLDDARELQLATDYLPFVSLDPGDGCTRDGFVVRVRKHPADSTKILIVYDHLFETDCGFGGHTGDDEVFGIAVDPAIPAPGGILAIRTASHQNTPCERLTQCTTCSNDSRPKCDLAAADGAMWPIVYASKDKHGQYATKAQCPTFGTCLDQCTLNPTRHLAPITNAGEPAHPLVTNLTAQGFITAANGWTKPELLNVDPWAPGDFGGAGNIADDLVDPAFEAAVCP